MIFIDSSFLIALTIERDQWHRQAVEVKNQIINQKYLISTFMLSEALTHIGSKAGGKMAKPVYDYVTSTNEIIYPSKDMFLSAIDKFMQYNGTVSYADVLALEIMESHGIDTIVSFDSDFDKVKDIKRIH